MADTSGGLEERDISGAPFRVNTFVNVRCLVQSIAPSAAGGNGGAADAITCLVETPGNVGERKNVTFVVGPTQCKKAGSAEQA